MSLPKLEALGYKERTGQTATQEKEWINGLCDEGSPTPHLPQKRLRARNDLAF